MDQVVAYWDNSNIFISAREVAAQRRGEGARARVRIHFRNLLELAHAGRPVKRALAVGSVPPELCHLWSSLENQGVRQLQKAARLANATTHQFTGELIRAALRTAPPGVEPEGGRA